jgi:hypothetical protein
VLKLTRRFLAVHRHQAPAPQAGVPSNVTSNRTLRAMACGANIGAVRTRGVEAEIAATTDAGVAFNLVASYNDAIYLSYPNGLRSQLAGIGRCASVDSQSGSHLSTSTVHEPQRRIASRIFMALELLWHRRRLAACTSPELRDPQCPLHGPSLPPYHSRVLRRVVAGAPARVK